MHFLLILLLLVLLLVSKLHARRLCWCLLLSLSHPMPAGTPSCFLSRSCSSRASSTLWWRKSAAPTAVAGLACDVSFSSLLHIFLSFFLSLSLSLSLSLFLSLYLSIYLHLSIYIYLLWRTFLSTQYLLIAFINLCAYLHQYTLTPSI